MSQVSAFLTVAFGGWVLGVGTVMLCVDVFINKEFPSWHSVMIGLIGMGTIIVSYRLVVQCDAGVLIWLLDLLKGC